MKKTDAAHTQGFSLLELMIAVAIVGILSALAIPTYQDYTIRAKVGEAFSLASAAKFSVSEYYVSSGELPADADQAGISSVSGKYVRSLSYSKSGSVGQVIVTFGNNVGAEVNGKKVVIEASISGNALHWACKSSENDGIDNKYLPASCR